MTGRHRAKRVPVPGIPRWVGHAVLEPHPGNGGGSAPRFRPRVELHPGRLLAWRISRRAGRASLDLWHSLYERKPVDQRREHHPSSGTRRPAST